ncbi:MAG: CooT family nickel-binding protein, partial [Candidatus Electrothrix sp. AR3]|nr:CooT family nickel-binding protein [Candidatus Electrothrix sp. AR3]
ELKTVMESVTALEVIKDGSIVLNTYFEDPLTVPGVHIRRIDFLGGAVVLAADESGLSTIQKEGNK